MEYNTDTNINDVEPVKMEINEAYEDKLTTLSQAIQKEQKLRQESEETAKKHLEKIQHLEKIIEDCKKKCDTTFDQLSTKANAIPEMIQEAIKPMVKMATDAVEQQEREKRRRIQVEELLEKVRHENDVLTKEKDELNRCAFNMECKIKELEVINAYQKDAVEDLKRKMAEQNEQYSQYKRQIKSFATVIRSKFDGITKILHKNFICKIFPRKVSKKKLRVVAAIEKVEELLQLHVAEIQNF
ncbi:golgin subfamily A member 6-like protein 25 [Hydractinia symbiolongicarpus]|uniref:golgin subfamily A member 6-like protein 25 n=1 Tax=Hydractinia symbiolongicarpus TaxID=13093 RepID=UPI00255036FE|nr:golgin subfamily A member 6-like protein 25 [Hydractinia symbiolongicarpus]